VSVVFYVLRIATTSLTSYVKGGINQSVGLPDISKSGFKLKGFVPQGV
jgi:hypothetical protein